MSRTCTLRNRNMTIIIKKQLGGRLQTVSVKMERRGCFGGTVEGGMDTLCS